jgi:hypothetical protein
MKKSVIIYLFLLGILVIPLIKADIYQGTCQGHVYYTEGNVVNEATVIGTVNLCIVGCSVTTTTESAVYNTGYYDMANLNLPKFQTLTVYAEKFNTLYNRLEFGSKTGTSNEFQAAIVDVVICLPPDPPTLIPEPNTHNTFAVLEWTSYPDFKGYSTYDDFIIDSQSPQQSPNSGVKSKTVSGLSFAPHTWRVRTCNKNSQGQTLCCSQWKSNTFNVGNLPPTAPVLTDQIDTTPGQVTLNWVSGTDPDGDETIDEYNFGIINSLNRKNLLDAISPQTEDVFSCNFYTWRVRTCEKESQNLCSSWVEDGFIVCGIECPTCGGGGGCGSGGGGGGGASCQPPYYLHTTTPPSVEEEQEILIKTSFSSTGNLNNLLFKIDSQDFDFNDFLVNKLEGKRADFNITGRLKPGREPGPYNFTLNVFVSNRQVFSELIYINIKRPLMIEIKRVASEIPKRKFFWPILLILIIFLISVYIYIRIKEKRNQEKTGKPKQPGFFSRMKLEE